MTDKIGRDQGVKRFLGVPYRWNARLMFDNVWKKDDPRLFLPKQFGWGWDMNLHALTKAVAKPIAKLKDGRPGRR